MVTTTIIYQGQLHCEAKHGPSGTVITTDAPKDNQGKGESFSPTDLVGTALGTCILSVMGIAARKLGIDAEIKGATAHVEKTMASAPIRRIQSLNVVVNMPKSLSDEHKKVLEHAANHCPVHKSLHPDIDAPIEFIWG